MVRLKDGSFEALVHIFLSFFINRKIIFLHSPTIRDLVIFLFFYILNRITFFKRRLKTKFDKKSK